MSDNTTMQNEEIETEQKESKRIDLCPWCGGDKFIPVGRGNCKQCLICNNYYGDCDV